MDDAQTEVAPYKRGRHVGLWLEPEDYEAFKKWSKDRGRTMAGQAKFLVLDAMRTTPPKQARRSVSD